jgi:GNAT superfamily N-acetyltransferase
MSNDSDIIETKLGNNETLKISEARSDDDYHRAYPVLKQLIPDLDIQTYAQRVFVARATGYRMFIAENSEDDVVGIIGVIHNHNLHDGFVTYIEQVVVDKDYRGQGIGAKLLEFAENRAKEEGCDWIELDTEIGEELAEKFYAKNGFKPTGKYHSKELI